MKIYAKIAIVSFLLLNLYFIYESVEKGTMLKLSLAGFSFLMFSILAVKIFRKTSN